MVALALPASALAVTSPAWNLNGEYSIDFTCTLGCVGDYPHTMNVTFTDLGNGQVAGTGHNSDTWTMTGTIAGTGVTFHIDYDSSTYTVDMIGAIAADGSMSGTATGPGQTFDWVSDRRRGATHAAERQRLRLRDVSQVRDGLERLCPGHRGREHDPCAGSHA